MTRKLFITSVSALALAATALPAQAQESGAYANIGVTLLSADSPAITLSDSGVTGTLPEQSVNIYTITGRLGYRIMDFLAIEGEAGFGLGGDDISDQIPVTVGGVGTVNVDADITVDINSYAVGFAKGILPAGENFELFARVGYGIAKAEADIAASFQGIGSSTSDSQDYDDFAYGVGAQYNFTDRQGIRLDYTSLGSDLQIISASYAINF